AMAMAWDDGNHIEEPHDPLIAHLRIHDHRILLIQFPRARCCPSISPFALKLETWLRVADLPYLNVSNKFRQRSTKGQIPYIELDGEQVADTHFIIKRLKKEFERNNPDADLSEEEVALTKSYLALIENRLFWVYENSLAHNNKWLATDDGFAGHFSKWKLRLFRLLALRPLKCMLRRNCTLQGVRRLTQLEIEAQAKADLTALSTLLGEKDYFFGDKPTTLDCSAYGLLIVFLHTPTWPTPIKRHLEENCANLVRMVQRIREGYWADWDEACSNLSLHTEWKRARMIAERYSLAPCEVSDSNLPETAEKIEKEDEEKKESEEGTSNREEKDA
ncbi:hypothetical protein PFISCL1PPCAC_18562, partial [Pristionchus fissidentatus]